MNDLERELRDLFGTKASEASGATAPNPRVLRRARRRQAGTVAATVTLTIALVVGSVAGLRAVLRSEPTPPRPAIPPVLPVAPEGFRAAALPFASIAYPEDWSLVADDPERTEGRILQLASFEFGVGWGNCEAGYTLPRGGVMLEVQLGGLQGSLPDWPVPLDVLPGWTRPCGADRVLTASWTRSGRVFSARGLVTPDASQEDVDLMTRAFESLTFPEAAPQTEELLGFANLVLDTADSPVGPVLLYAYADLDDVVREEPSYWIGIAGPAGSRLAGAGQIGRDPPHADENVTMSLDAWGGIVWGNVSDAVARAELRTVEGATFPATLVQLPDTVVGGQAVWGAIEGTTADRVTTLLYDEEGNVLNDSFPTGPRITIATGTDPEGGPWELYLEPTNDGTGLGFGFENGGGGGGCCLRPLRRDFQLDGYGSGGGEPSDITALTSEAVTRIVFEAASGERIEGDLYPVPDASLGIPQVGLVLVPSTVTLEGQLVAYDENGVELGREDIGDDPEPPGPTTVIDVVWERLRRARDVVQEYEARHQGSLSGFDALEASKIDPGIGGDPGIRWNDGALAEGEVSIRGVARAGGSELTGWSGWNVVLVSATVGPQGSVGSVYCIAVNIDEGGGGNFRYGTQDASTYEDCRGGWG